MTEKHIDEIDQIARDIYSLSAQRINAYLQDQQQKGYYPFEMQIEDYHLIAERASIYIFGNAIAMMDESLQEECTRKRLRRAR